MTDRLFVPFPSIARLRRDCVITEKIDGTNAQIVVPEDVSEPILVGSRNRWITPADDNYGFARWVADHDTELRVLGSGQHFGEWWGAGIQRRYGVAEKRFSLFNTTRWAATGVELPACVRTVPILYEGVFTDEAVEEALKRLRSEGSSAAPGFMDPEGVVVYLSTSRQFYKVTIGGDGHKTVKEHK